MNGRRSKFNQKKEAASDEARRGAADIDRENQDHAFFDARFLASWCPREAAQDRSHPDFCEWPRRRKDWSWVTMHMRRAKCAPDCWLAQQSRTGAARGGRVAVG